MFPLLMGSSEMDPHVKREKKQKQKRKSRRIDKNSMVPSIRRVPPPCCMRMECMNKRGVTPSRYNRRLPSMHHRRVLLLPLLQQLDRNLLRMTSPIHIHHHEHRLTLWCHPLPCRKPHTRRYSRTILPTKCMMLLSRPVLLLHLLSHRVFLAMERICFSPVIHYCLAIAVAVVPTVITRNVISRVIMALRRHSDLKRNGRAKMMNKVMVGLEGIPPCVWPILFFGHPPLALVPPHLRIAPMQKSLRCRLCALVPLSLL